MNDKITIRRPTPTDGHQLFDLVAQCPPLDANSMYCNLLQCSHFADTSAAAEQQGKLVGFVSGYLVPERPNTLFVWQVAVSGEARGKGVATRLITHILNRAQCQNVNWIETTVTKSNDAPWALFKGLAGKLKTELKQSLMFDENRHFNGRHDSEFLARIGPFSLAQSEADTNKS